MGFIRSGTELPIARPRFSDSATGPGIRFKSALRVEHSSVNRIDDTHITRAQIEDLVRQAGSSGRTSVVPEVVVVRPTGSGHHVMSVDTR